VTTRFRFSLLKVWSIAVVALPLLAGLIAYALGHDALVLDLSGPQFISNAEPNVDLPITFRLKNVSEKGLEARITRRSCACISPKVVSCKLERGGTGSLAVDLRSPLEDRFDGSVLVEFRSLDDTSLLDAATLHLGCAVKSTDRFRVSPSRIVLGHEKTGELTFRMDLHYLATRGRVPAWMNKPEEIRVTGQVIRQTRLLSWSMESDAAGVGSWEVVVDTNAVLVDNPARISVAAPSGEATAIELHRE
jgi:hypothetical protein